MHIWAHRATMDDGRWVWGICRISCIVLCLLRASCENLPALPGISCCHVE